MCVIISHTPMHTRRGLRELSKAEVLALAPPGVEGEQIPAVRSVIQALTGGHPGDVACSALLGLRISRELCREL